jgi:hypothetical protein
MGNGTRKEKEKEGPFSFSILCQVRRAGQGIWTLITLLAMHRPSPLEMLMIYAWLILTRILTAAPATATAMDPSVDGDDETTRIGVTWGKRASACSNGRHASIPFFPRGRVSWWLGRHPIPMQLQSASDEACTCKKGVAWWLHPSLYIFLHLQHFIHAYASIDRRDTRILRDIGNKGNHQPKLHWTSPKFGAAAVCLMAKRISRPPPH